MKYSIKGHSVSNGDANIGIKNTSINFGVTASSANLLANPAELFLASFAACTLKNVERFSALMKFDYVNAEIEVQASRKDKPPRMDDIFYSLKIISNDGKLNIELLKKNIEKFGTIYNTAKKSCEVSGEIIKLPIA